MNKISIPYKVIIKKMYLNSHDGKLPLAVAKRILTYRFRMPRQSLTSIFSEMKKMKLIEIEKQRYVVLLLDKKYFLEEIENYF